MPKQARREQHRGKALKRKATATSGGEGGSEESGGGDGAAVSEGRTQDTGATGCVATLVAERARANAVAAVPLPCATATVATEWDPAKPFAWVSQMPEQTQAQAKQQRRGRARMHELAKKTSADEPAGSEAAAVNGRLEAKAETRAGAIDFAAAAPTLTHYALTELARLGKLK